MAGHSRPKDGVASARWVAAEVDWLIERHRSRGATRLSGAQSLVSRQVFFRNLFNTR
jgi:hypothetical protein